MPTSFGRYEAIREIAQGGMATVYLGRVVGEGGFERLVAIKAMHPHIADKPEFEAMFLDEARLAARIRHPNVVSTLDVQKTDGQMFLVMEYVDGPALNRILRRHKVHNRRIPFGITLRIVIDTLSGLDAAHELSGPDGGPLNLVHRDVSPQNILVGYDGIVKIGDFGVARANARLGFTEGGEIKGKLGYMPPEQSRGETLDRRADIYAVGVVLWEGLTLERLFHADNPGEMVYRLLQGAQRSPREMVPDVPKLIDQACMNALSLDPKDRYQTAADFADALEIAALHSGVRIASARALAAWTEEVRPIVEGDGEREGAPELDFASIAGSLPTRPIDPRQHGFGNLPSTGRPHTLTVRMVPPSQGRRVTIIAVGTAAVLGLGAAVVPFDLFSGATADRVRSEIAKVSHQTAVAAEAAASAEAVPAAVTDPSASAATTRPPVPRLPPRAPGKRRKPPAPPEPKEQPKEQPKDFRPKGL